MVVHMVWIKFRDGVTPRRIAEHLDALRGLTETVPGVLSLTAGENFTDRSAGFTHGLCVTLASRDALAAYASHPAHVAVAEPLRRDAELRALDVEAAD